MVAVFMIPNTLPAEQKVVVVGAGIAGLTAANRLQEMGFDVEVYEARSRVGGRILTAFLQDKFIELGGMNLADGGEAKNLRRLIHECGLSTVESQFQLNFDYYTGEKWISEKEFAEQIELNPAKLKVQINAAKQKSKNMKELLGSLFVEKNDIYSMLAVRLEAYEGGAIERLSSNYAETLYYMLMGGVCFSHQKEMIQLATIAGGNTLLPEKLAERLGERVHLHSPLQKVSKIEGGGYFLTFSGGEEVKADILVLAIPCSIYQEIQFEDSIPEEKLQAIQNVEYGQNAKLIIPCQTISSHKKSFFNDHLIGFNHSEIPLIGLYYVREASRFSKETIEATLQKEQPVIESLFQDGGPIFLNPVVAQDSPFVCYEGPVGYSWSNDPFVKGSYSYIAAGQEELLTTIQEEQGERVRTLFAPIDNRLFFAGEHTSILLDVAGTMEAACESGERTARLVEKMWRGSGAR